MNDESCGSAYDSASSRAHAPQAGAALKSTSTGLCCDLAWLSAASASLIHETDISLLSSCLPDPWLLTRIGCSSGAERFYLEKRGKTHHEVADDGWARYHALCCMLSPSVPFFLSS